jgi:hypothetical protein
MTPGVSPKIDARNREKGCAEQRQQEYAATKRFVSVKRNESSNEDGRENAY